MASRREWRVHALLAQLVCAALLLPRAYAVCGTYSCPQGGSLLSGTTTCQLTYTATAGCALSGFTVSGSYCIKDMCTGSTPTYCTGPASAYAPSCVGGTYGAAVKIGTVYYCGSQYGAPDGFWCKRSDWTPIYRCYATRTTCVRTCLALG